jgi:hypothetical protein
MEKIIPIKLARSSSNIPRVKIMLCKACHSDKQSLFNGEIAIHFPGLEGLNKSIIWVFARLLVCLLAPSPNS